MGLDWVLEKTRPRMGMEREFAEVSARIGQMKKDGADPGPGILRELEGVTQSAFELVEAPRVGIDEAATEFFRQEVYEPARREALSAGRPGIDPWLRPYEEILEEHRGRYVVALAEVEEGLPAVAGAATGIDFRGDLVGRSILLPDELRQEAYRDHGPAECLDYAEAIEDHVERHKHLRDRASRLVTEQEGHLAAAVRWLRFWGSQGFGFVAWR